MIIKNEYRKVMLSTIIISTVIGFALDLSTNYFILSNLTDFDYIFKE